MSSQPLHVKLNRHMSCCCHSFQESKHPDGCTTTSTNRYQVFPLCPFYHSLLIPCAHAYPPLCRCRYEIELLSLHSIVRHLYINPALAFVALEEEACQEVSPCHFMESRNSTFDFTFPLMYILIATCCFRFLSIHLIIITAKTQLSNINKVEKY